MLVAAISTPTAPDVITRCDTATLIFVSSYRLHRLQRTRGNIVVLTCLTVLFELFKTSVTLKLSELMHTLILRFLLLLRSQKKGG
jgi:hypothetical protein